MAWAEFVFTKRNFFSLETHLSDHVISYRANKIYKNPNFDKLLYGKLFTDASESYEMYEELILFFYDKTFFGHINII